MSIRRCGVTAALLAVVAVALLGGATGAGAKSSARAANPKLGVGPAHWYRPGAFGTFGTFGKAAPLPAAPSNKSGIDNLSNTGNNEIMPTTNTYLIFWLPSGQHYSSSVGDANYENQMIRYFQDVGGSQILNTTTQYPGNNGTPNDASTFQTSVVDTNAYPHSGTVADPLTQNDLNGEVFNQITAHSWPLGLSTMYFVFLPNGVVDCDSSGTNCNTNTYCAYHTYGWSGSDTPANDFVWADIPDNRSPTTTLGGCGDSNVSGDESADTTLSSVEHEHLEAITDPRLNAWRDSTGAENGDKCNRNMGVANGSSTTANNFLGASNADPFRIQREWSNAVSGCAASYTSTGSQVESPAPSGSDVTKSVAQATIAGNTGDGLDYTLTFKNPSNQDDAFNVVVTDTLPAGVQSGGSGTVVLDLGDLAPHQTVTRSFTAHPTGPLAAGATLTNSASFAFDDSTGAAQPAIVRTATTTVVNTAPTLNALPDPQSVDYHDALSFAVSATDPDAGDTLVFSAAGLPAGLSLTDHGDGTATVSGTDTAAPGDYTATISVTDQHHAPVSAQMTIHVLREQTTASFGSVPPAILAGGGSLTLNAQLLEDGTTAPSPSGQTITLSLGSQSCLANVDASGNASCSISTITTSLGPQTLTATFAGDAYYLPSSATASTVVFAFPSRGAFTLGDATVASAGPSTTVTWWSNNWSGLNALSGGSAPPSFKGFAGVVHLPTTTPPASCAGTFMTTGGNSPPPPSGVPSYMGVLVPNTVGKSGSTITGAYGSIVVVHINPGYAPNPNSAGTGTIVAVYC